MAPGQSRRQGWLLILTAFVLALYSWGLGFYGQAVFISELRSSRQWSASVVSGALTLYFVTGALFLAYVPAVFKRLGPRTTTTIGAAVLAASAASLSLTTAPWQLFVINLVMAFGWATTSGTAVVLLIAPWFEKRRGLAVSLALNGASAAGFLIAPLLLVAIHGFGFNSAVPVFAGVMFLVIVPILLAGARYPPTGYAEYEPGSTNPSGVINHPADSSTHKKVTVEDRFTALRSRQFWSIAAPYALGMVAQVGFLMHQVALLSPLLGATRTGMAVAATTMTAVLGRIGFGFVADRLDARRTSATIFLIQAVSVALMIAGSQYGPAVPLLLFAGSAGFGLSVGIAITLPALVTSDEYSPASFGLVVGLTGAIIQFSFAFGPLLLGLMRDWSENYATALVFCIGCEVVAAVMIVRGNRNRPKSP